MSPLKSSRKLIHIFIAVFAFATLVAAPRAFASDVLPSAITTNNWYVTDINGSPVSCPSGSPDKWAQYNNDVLITGPITFFCSAPPWVSNITAFYNSQFGTPVAGDKIRYEFYNGSTELGHIESFYTGSEVVALGATTTTRIVSTVPVNNGVTATTTFTLGGQVYVNSDDFSDDMYLRVTVNSVGGLYCANSAIAIDAFTCHDSGGADPILTYYDFPITASSTLIDFSTTTTRKAGLASASYSLRDPYFFGLLYSQKAFRATQFTVATTTAIDNVILATRQSLASTTLDYFANCNPISSWDFMKCLSGATTYLFVPSAGQINNAVQQFHDDVLTRVPFGYITRLVGIFKITTSVQPPPISYTFGSSSPAVLQGDTYEIQIYDHFDEVNSIRTDDGQNKGLWDVIDPFIQALVGISVLWVIIHDVIKLGEKEVTHAVNKEANKKS